MVKPRQPVKLSKASRLAATSAAAKRAAATATPKEKHVKKAELLPTCVDCGIDISNDVKALQCELCPTDAWKCAHCLGLSDEMYDFLAASQEHGLHWFCGKCEKIIVEGSGSPCIKLEGTVQKLVDKSHDIELQVSAVTGNVEQALMDVNSKLEQLMNEKIKDIEQKLLDKVQSIEQTLQRKVENDLLEKIDGRLRKIEDSPAVIEDIQLRLEHKVDQLRNNMDEPVAVAVQGLIQEDKAEEMEIEHRKKNVIVHGVSESEAEASEDRISDDLAVLAAMFQEVKVDDIQVESVVRLGKKASDPVQNPRPMKLVLNSEENKINLLKNAKNLREKREGGWSKVFIHQDLTPKQREARKPLVAELKERKANGEKDLTIFRGKIVKKRSY